MEALLAIMLELAQELAHDPTISFKLQTSGGTLPLTNETAKAHLNNYWVDVAVHARTRIIYFFLSKGHDEIRATLMNGTVLGTYPLANPQTNQEITQLIIG